MRGCALRDGRAALSGLYRNSTGKHPLTMASKNLTEDLVQALDNLFGLHPGFRPVHAKGIFFSGDFTPSAQVASLTRAPHAQGQTTPVTVRFSDFAGIPTVPDNDPNV